MLLLLFAFILVANFCGYKGDKPLEKITMIKKKLEDGEDFCKLVKKYSQDEGSVMYCGEIGLFGKGELAKNYEFTMMSMKIGETSNIIETEFGYHIIQLLDIINGKYRTRHILIKH
ncbi:MAG TPA: peptidylprolyl isomerase [Cytophagaceae bacterium]|nr:peptidylprolyl isomerase [Cytophagaceae bacterium]